MEDIGEVTGIICDREAGLEKRFPGVDVRAVPLDLSPAPHDATVGARGRGMALVVLSASEVDHATGGEVGGGLVLEALGGGEVNGAASGEDGVGDGDDGFTGTRGGGMDDEAMGRGGPAFNGFPLAGTPGGELGGEAKVVRSEGGGGGHTFNSLRTFIKILPR